MNNTIVYRPYKSHAWFLPFITPVGILAFVVVGYCFVCGGDTIFWAAIGITGTWLIKFLYDTSNHAIVFEQEGLRIVGGSYKDYRYIRWEEIPNAYYVKNFKGFLFLVLSPKVLDPKEAKKLAGRGANSSKIYIDDVVVIHIDVLQNAAQITEFIANHAASIDGEWL